MSAILGLHGKGDSFKSFIAIGWSCELARLIGFGGGYIVNDQVGGHDRTVTVQHKRDPNRSLFDGGSPRCTPADKSLGATWC